MFCNRNYSSPENFAVISQRENPKMLTISMSLSIPKPPQNFSSSKALSSASLFLPTQLSLLSLTSTTSNKKITFKTLTIRMGGGPRTYPGGVSKWQWKRMQAKKAKQLLRARLARERQIYEMRKRAELKAAVSELERPWEVVEKAPTLFSVSADEQLKVLADRFQKPGGFDMWSNNDGPQLFQTIDGLPSARFFPKGVVHSIKPYAKIEDTLDSDGELRNSGLDRESGNESRNKMEVNRFGNSKKSRKPKIGSISRNENEGLGNENEMRMQVQRFGNKKYSRRFQCRSGDEERNLSPRSPREVFNDHKTVNDSRGKFRQQRNRRSSGSMDTKSGQIGSYHGHSSRSSSEREFIRGENFGERKELSSKVYDMSLQQDGSYEFGA